MKKRLNTIFFSLCFLGSVMAVAYFMQAGEGNLFSVIALGIVVLITGYLCMDSIRSKLTETGKEFRHYFDQMYHEETQHLNERFNELQNLQKATYTATKKNTAILSEQLEMLLDRIEVLEGNNTKALQKLIELQKKALEGQKNALGLEINYSKENTKQLMKVIAETGNQTETLVLMNKLVDQLERSTQVLQNELQNMNVTVQAPTGNLQYGENNWDMNTGAKVENLTETGWDVEAEVELDEKPSDWHSDADPVFEEVDHNWSNTTVQSLSMDWDTSDHNAWSSEGITEEASDIDNSWNNIDSELNKLMEGFGYETAEENTPETNPSQIEEPIPEVIEAIGEPATEESRAQKPEIKPLYEDPNKALSADEIAALFASFGQ